MAVRCSTYDPSQRSLGRSTLNTELVARSPIITWQDIECPFEVMGPGTPAGGDYQSHGGIHGTHQGETIGSKATATNVPNQALDVALLQASHDLATRYG